MFDEHDNDGTGKLRGESLDDGLVDSRDGGMLEAWRLS